VTYIPEPTDPFYGSEKIPSLSWKGLPPGSTFELIVLDAAKAIQSRNFESGQPDYWDAEKTRPKMAAVLNVLVVSGPHSAGEDRSIWAQIPSNMFIALKEAQKTAESRFAPGGTLYLRFTGEVPHENKRYSPIKQYEAKYVPPVFSTASDPFAPTPEPEQPQAPAPAPQPGRPAWAQAAVPATTLHGWRSS
jgi:hypothetical protein